MKGWRREAFGEKALRLKRGEIGLVMKGKRVRVFDVAADAIVEDEPEMDGDEAV
jgi:ribonuclease D